eukprot:ANDGO_03134.mRNA.1 endonuclease
MTGSREVPKDRLFDKAMKDACWNASKPVQGRDPERWRLDPAGNIVSYVLRGCTGCLCHDYDHIVPYSKGGKTELSNCQILQSRANKIKGNKTDVSRDELKSWSCAVQYSDDVLDVFEMALYGNVKRPARMCRCLTIGELGKMIQKGQISAMAAAAQNYCVRPDAPGTPSSDAAQAKLID